MPRLRLDPFGGGDDAGDLFDRGMSCLSLSLSLCLSPRLFMKGDSGNGRGSIGHRAEVWSKAQRPKLASVLEEAAWQ